MKKIRYFLPIAFLLSGLVDYAGPNKVKGEIEIIGAAVITVTLIHIHYTKIQQDRLNSVQLINYADSSLNPFHQEIGRYLQWYFPIMIIFGLLFDVYLQAVLAHDIGDGIVSYIPFLFTTVFFYVAMIRFMKPQIIDIDSYNVTFTPIPVIGYPRRKVAVFPTSKFTLRLDDIRAKGGPGFRLALVGTEGAPSCYLEFPKKINQLEYARRLGEALNIKVEGAPEMSSPSEMTHA